MTTDTHINPDNMIRKSGQLGSNPAGIYQAKNGQRYYIKTLESLAHCRNEFIAAKLYQLAGVPTLNYFLCTEPEQIATQWVDLDKKSIKHFSIAERQQAQQWFAVHAWLANWDVAGFNGDNQGVINNVVVTLDVGGALNFRAMGDPKGAAFSTHVAELTRLRSDPDNPHARALFAKMDKTAIKKSIDIVLKLSNKQISNCILKNGGSEKLLNKMLARKDDMAQWL